VAFTKKLLDTLEGQYCIDQARVFSVGMSYGGIMSNTLGCQMGDVFRAIAPMSGMGPNTYAVAGGGPCKGQVAVWMSHGNQDNVVAFSQGQASRDYWAKANHCASTTMPTDPSPCVAYTGCDDGFPVHWCEFDGGHTIPSFAADGIWKFLSQF
jgi:poly(3-hydroxybutyrate) depolymerase